VDAVRDLLGLTADHAGQSLDELEQRPVRPSASIEELRAAPGGPLTRCQTALAAAANAAGSVRA
jgi:hypothetical protein